MAEERVREYASSCSRQLIDKIFDTLMVEKLKRLERLGPFLGKLISDHRLHFRGSATCKNPFYEENRQAVFQFTRMLRDSSDEGVEFVRNAFIEYVSTLQEMRGLSNLDIRRLCEGAYAEFMRDDNTDTC